MDPNQKVTNFAPKFAPSHEYQWSRDKVLALICSVEEYFDDFYDKSLKKKYIWNNVANHMSERGFTCTGLACDKKWRDLKSSYATALQQQRQGNSNTEFEYFDALHHILGQEVDPSETPGQRISLEGEEEEEAADMTQEEFKDLTHDDGFVWDDEEVHLLLNYIMESQEAFAAPDSDIRAIWEDIAQQMSHVGGEVTSKQCQRKWDNLEEGLRVHQARAESTGVLPLWPYYAHTREVAEAVTVHTTIPRMKKIRVKSQVELRSGTKDTASKTSRKNTTRTGSPSKAAKPRAGKEQSVLARVKHLESSLNVKHRLERLEARVESSRQQQEATRKTNVLLVQVLAELRRINAALKQEDPLEGMQGVQVHHSDPSSCSPKNQEFIIVEAYADPL